MHFEKNKLGWFLIICELRETGFLLMISQCNLCWEKMTPETQKNASRGTIFKTKPHPPLVKINFDQPEICNKQVNTLRKDINGKT